ncbi:hypothetical protein V2G26_014191 [Clonostachys chloroleuca]
MLGRGGSINSYCGPSDAISPIISKASPDRGHKALQPSSIVRTTPGHFTLDHPVGNETKSQLGTSRRKAFSFFFWGLAYG